MTFKSRGYIIFGMHTKILHDFAQIISGYSFRNSIQEVQNGNLYVLQSKNITSNQYICDDELLRIENEGYNTAAFIKNDDVIITSRGSFRSAVIKTDKIILAASSVYIIRIKNNAVLPEYLALFLNSRRAQGQLLQVSTGAVINNLKRKNLEKIKVTIPDIVSQKKIIDLHHTGALFSKLLVKKSNLVKDLAVEMINTL